MGHICEQPAETIHKKEIVERALCFGAKFVLRVLFELPYGVHADQQEDGHGRCISYDCF